MGKNRTGKYKRFRPADLVDSVDLTFLPSTRRGTLENGSLSSLETCILVPVSPTSGVYLQDESLVVTWFQDEFLRQTGIRLFLRHDVKLTGKEKTW